MVALTILVRSTFCVLGPIAFLNGWVVMQTSRAAYSVSLGKKIIRYTMLNSLSPYL